MQPSSPDPDRSAREWKQIQRALRESPLIDFLRRADTIVHTEFPFLWPIDDGSCLEGVIDLLAVDPQARRCLLLDWKTNRIAADKVGTLRAKYRSQLAAYWKAVSAITGFTVDAGLFSIAQGELLVYDRTELSDEWQRLEQLPPPRLKDEIAPPDLD